MDWNELSPRNAWLPAVTLGVATMLLNLYGPDLTLAGRRERAERSHATPDRYASPGAAVQSKGEVASVGEVSGSDQVRGAVLAGIVSGGMLWLVIVLLTHRHYVQRKEGAP